jgi:hypothetical protein
VHSDSTLDTSATGAKCSHIIIAFTIHCTYTSGLDTVSVACFTDNCVLS